MSEFEFIDQFLAEYEDQKITIYHSVYTLPEYNVSIELDNDLIKICIGHSVQEALEKANKHLSEWMSENQDD